MVWKKLHHELWWNLRLRAQSPELRCVLVDLLTLCDEEGNLERDLPEGFASRSDLERLAALGFLELHESSIVVLSVKRDRAFSRSRRAGGLARKAQKDRASGPRAKHGAEHDAKHDAEQVLSKMPASCSPSSSSSGGKGAGKGGRRAGVDVAKMDLPSSLDLPAIRVALAAYQDSRRELKHPPLGAIGLSRLVAKLAAWGPERALAALEHTIANGWQGVFEPKEGDAPGKQRGAAPAPVRPTPSATETSEYLKGLREQPVGAPPANLREIYERAKKSGPGVARSADA